MANRILILIVALILIIFLPDTMSAQIPYQYRPEEPNYLRTNSFWKSDTTVNKRKLGGILGTAIGSYTTLFTVMGTSWYTTFPKSKFHFFNDAAEWKQLDKFGHSFSGYQGSRAMIQMLKWSGVKKRHAVLWGGLSGFLSLMPIEILDGFSRDWGASWHDLVANGSGAGLATLNEALWDEQRITMSLSFHQTAYAKIRPSILGDKYSSWLKDYNGMTFWLNGRIHSFLPEGKLKGKFPRWLGISVGTGANGLLGGHDNIWENDAGDVFDYSSVDRYREYYLSFYIDLANIKTRWGALDWILGTISFIHIPMPTLEVSKKGLRFHPIFF